MLKDFFKKVEQRSDLFLVLLSVIIFVLFNFHVFYIYLSSQYVPGWDGTGHATLAYLYYQNVFPSFFGYLDIWFNGMPFPQFYPPLFYFLTSFLAVVGDHSTYFFLFKTAVILILISLVPAFYFLSKNILIKKHKALVSTLLFSVVLSIYSASSDTGVSVEANINTGLLTQTLSFLFFLIFLNFWNKAQSFRNRLISVIALAAIALSNVHVLVIAVFYIFVDLIFILVGRDFKLFIQKGIDSFFSMLITSFWLLPMVYYYEYSSAKSWVWNPGISIATKIIIVVILLSSLAILFLRKQDRFKKVLSVYFIIILGLVLFNDVSIFGNLPFHPIRWFVAPYLLFPILIVHIIFYEKFPSNQKKRAVIFFSSLFTLILLIFVFSYKVRDNEGFYLKAKSDRLEDIAEYAKNNFDLNNDVVNVETTYLDDKESTLYTFNSILGINNIKTSYNIFRESSGSSFATVAIRNSLSEQDESWGIKATLANNKEYKEKDFDLILQNAINLGINKYLVRSSFIRRKMNKSELVLLEKDFGNWKLYSAKKQAEFATKEELATVATYTNLNLKENDKNLYEWTRIVEGQIYSGKTDLVFYKTQEDLAVSNEYVNSSVVLIADYENSNFDKAFSNIENMIKTKKVFFVSNVKSDLYIKIRDKYKNNSNAIFIYPPDRYLKMYDFLNSYEKVINQIYAEAIKNKNGNWNYEMKSYFPDISKSENKEYLASPFYVLKSKTEKQENKNIPAVGYAVSIISLIVYVLIFKKLIPSDN